MRHLALACVLAAGPAAAEPELGTSSKGRSWLDPPAPAVTSIFVSSRHGTFEYWEASVDGIAIDHDRFYELVGRGDLARTAKRRRTFGALTIAGGVAVAVFGARAVLQGHAAGAALYLGGFGVSLVGAYFVLTPDSTSASEARRLVVGFGAKF
jgi:hypothetical protein